MKNAPEVRGPTGGEGSVSAVPHSTVPRQDRRPAGAARRRRGLTEEQVAELLRLKPMLESMVLAKGLGRDLEDVVQTCVVKLVARWSDPGFTLDRQDGGRAFAAKVMSGVIADVCRAYDRDKSFPTDEIPDRAPTAPETSAYFEVQAVQAVDGLLRQALPDEGGMYEVGRLSIVKGLNQTEISRYLEIDRQTVKRRLDKVRGLLAAYRATIHDELGDVG
ncbi:sigma-70 family RNA polymerase sigma factor [Streptomyces sp. NPDC059134]|uniref:sigma-70 family RNA polymerase sigma factor n=1 Tax=Streptomyces sp. NPDC059134 TaxID=3346738 RepID=UPI0036CAC103